MLRSSMTGFNKYDVNDSTVHTAKKWEGDHMYKTSYFKLSEKNVKKIKIL